MAKNRSSAALKITAPVFAALGDETRLRLVTRLCDESPQSITQLTEDTGLTRQGVTKHLQVLEDVGLVRSLKQGRENLFELEVKPMRAAREYLDEVSRQWDQALQRLKDFVEK